jgi:diacylglycerol kinase family enzyme
VPASIAAVESEPGHNGNSSPDEKLAHAVRRYRDVLSHLKPRRWEVTVDGDAMDGDYLLLEVLNISSVGPNLMLSPGADVSDGLLDVVAAGEGERGRIERYLSDRMAGREARLELPVTRARRVEVAGWEAMHVDDEVIAGPAIGVVAIGVEPGAVEILL